MDRPASLPAPPPTGSLRLRLAGWLVPDRPSSALRQMAVGLWLAAMALLVKIGIGALSGEDIGYLPFFAVLPVAVLLAGPGAGALLTVVGAALDGVLLQTPGGWFEVQDSSAVLRLVLFVPIGLALSYLVGGVARSRQEAAQAAGRLARFLDAVPDPAFVVDPVTARIEEANSAAQRLAAGGDPLVGRDISGLIRGIALDETGPAGPVTLGLETSDGDEVAVEVIVRSVDLPNGQQRFLVSAHDIHDRIDSEIRLLRLARAERSHAETLAAVLGSIDDGLGLIGPDDKMIMTNDALVRMAGGPVASGAALDAALAGRPDGDLVHVDRDQRWIRILERPVDSDAARRLVLVRDVTREREALAARDAFLGVLSHELRTPVTTIFGLAHVLRRTLSRGGTASLELVSDVAAEARRLNELIEDLLVLSRAEIGSVVVDPEPVLLSHVIGDVVETEKIRSPHVTFEVQIPANLPPASGDATFIGQVLRNLIGNAAKYGPRTPCVVRIVLTVEGGELTVRVFDEGPGFDPADGPHLFDIFFRGDRTARQQAGSGIGLYVTRVLVTAMGGRTWARPNEPTGAEFGFSLPALAPDRGDLPGSPPPA